MRPHESCMEPNKQNWLIIVYDDSGRVLYQHSAVNLTQEEADKLAVQAQAAHHGESCAAKPA